MKRFGLVLAALLLSFTLLLAPKTHADLGDFSGGGDYGGSSGSDYGGSSSWGSSSDSYSSGSTYYSSGSGSDSDGGDGFGAIMSFVIVAIIFYFVFIRRSKKNASSAKAAGAQRTAQSALRPMSEYVSVDPNFVEADMKEKLSNIYVQMQNCCTKKDIEPLRPYFTDALYQQFDRQIKTLKERKLTNYVDRIAVLGVELRGFFIANGEDHIVAELRTRITDYTLSDETGKLVSGDQKAEKFMTYEYDLSRPSGQTTQAAGAVTERHCPNCGAPLSINESAKCPYCDAVITLAEHDWTIYAVKGVAQQTVK